MTEIFTPPGLLNSARWKGLRIGILGGSFNPPHIGHVHISLAALKGLQLDCVWWLVTPQNPLKRESPAAMQERLDHCRALTDSHPKILISAMEGDLGTHNTHDTIAALKRHYPKHSFVWVSGMDSALSLHQWNRWRDLLGLIPMLHLTRKPATSLIKRCPLRLYAPQKHVFIDRGGDWPLTPGTTYWMLQNKMVNISSSDIRAGAVNHSKI